MRYLNLGCGDRFHPDWENLDLYPTSPAVRAWDLRKKTPFADETFDVVYHSHVLEHFPRRLGFALLQECHRVLKPGGAIRVAVPDLERIARLYVEALDKASNGVPGWDRKHEWMITEMYDQCVREHSGGSFADYHFYGSPPDFEFILERWGTYGTESARGLLDQGLRQPSGPPPKRAWGYVLHNPGKVLLNKLGKTVMGAANWEALRVGRFRQAGEVHKWMYDRRSLAGILEKAGFVNPRKVGPTESAVQNWASFSLDTDPDGSVYKADSMYMEALKP
jgi:SAM-dependent methyltransferase